MILKEKTHYLALFSIILCGWSAALGAGLPVVDLPEDEFVLPPYLLRFEGGLALNVGSGGKKHAAQEREWLDLDQEFDLQDRLAVQVLMHEKLQWVGGGVLKLRLEQKEWKRPLPPYRLHLDRGLLALWVKATTPELGIEIITPQEKLSLQEGVCWVSASAGVTEVYLMEGTIKDSTGKIWTAKKHVSFKVNPDQSVANTTSVAWDAEAYKVRISGSYPNWVKLVDQAQEDWLKNKVVDLYSEVRKKGWRKSLRR